jgi:hypothetical protein
VGVIYRSITLRFIVKRVLYLEMKYKKGEEVMKLFKGMLMGMVVAGVMILLSSVSFADKGHEQEKIKLLNDSAAALQASNPILAASLTTYANDEANEAKEKAEGKKELEGAKEDAMKMHREDHIKLLRDAAVALQVSKPDLSASLTKMADRHAKMMMKEGKEDKEEAGEKDENEGKEKK